MAKKTTKPRKNTALPRPETPPYACPQTPPEAPPPAVAGAFRTLAVFVLAQATGWGLVLLAPLPETLGLMPRLLIQSATATLVAALLKSPVWWLWIQAAFGPLVVLALSLALPAHWYLLGFVVLALVYGASPRTRVPLYLSNTTTITALAHELPAHPGRFLDAGCGTGSVIASLARTRPDWQFTGVEYAWLPWLWARWRTRTLPNVKVIRGDYFLLNWASFDCVYVFLSPAPMATVEAKAATELGENPSGARVISNSFPLPHRAPSTVQTLNDRRQTHLYVYAYGGLS
jgi:hypothetical protein